MAGRVLTRLAPAHASGDCIAPTTTRTRNCVPCWSPAPASNVYPAELGPGGDGGLTYPALTPDVPAAFWYERALHDLSGVTPAGHPRLDPLLLPREPASCAPPRTSGPGGEVTGNRPASAPSTSAGTGVFTLPLGPVRSGVYESIEFLIETPGEEIPHFNIRPHYKHRGIAKTVRRPRRRRRHPVAERVEGIASVAHALAFAHAVETSADVEIPPRAELIRVIHAELERIANHLDVACGCATPPGSRSAPPASAGIKNRSCVWCRRCAATDLAARWSCVGGVSTPPRMNPARRSRDAVGRYGSSHPRDRRALMETRRFWTASAAPAGWTGGWRPPTGRWDRSVAAQGSTTMPGASAL